MAEKPKVYFIAIIPPEKICAEIIEIKKDFGDRFKSVASLKTIPHITLKAPFKFTTANTDETVKWFQQMAIHVKPFDQKLKNFGAFHNARNPVVYVKPVMNEGLSDLQKEILLNFQKQFPNEKVSDIERQYSPHMTVAYRDLTSKSFKDAWPEYEAKKFEASFNVESFHLLQHDTKRWNTVSTFYLQ